MPFLVAALLLFSTGCTGMLLDQLQERHVSSCVWWQSHVTGLRSVSATGGATLEQCLAVPCQGR